MRRRWVGEWAELVWGWVQGYKNTVVSAVDNLLPSSLLELSPPLYSHGRKSQRKWVGLHSETDSQKLFKLFCVASTLLTSTQDLRYNTRLFAGSRRRLLSFLPACETFSMLSWCKLILLTTLNQNSNWCKMHFIQNLTINLLGYTIGGSWHVYNPLREW